MIDGFEKWDCLRPRRESRRYVPTGGILGLLGLLCLLGLLSGGCGRRPASAASPMTEGQDEAGTEERLRVVATIFPYYDFVRQVAGDAVDLKLIVPAGMDSHSFEPTPAQMRSIQEADVLICNGGAMEHWVSQVLDAVDAPQLTVVTMMEHVDVVGEEIVEGMEDEAHGHDFGHDHGNAPAAREGTGVWGVPAAVEGTGMGNAPAARVSDQIPSDFDHDGREEEIEYDEHIWTSPVNAMEMVRVIRDVLSEQDQAHAADYEAGASAFLEELRTIHEGFLQVSEARKRNMIVVGDKFPFRYLVEEYDLTYRAAFSGCSTDTEPSARTIAYLIDKVREGRIPVVYYLELSSSRVAEIIGEETGAKPLLLHSCHNVTRAQFESGVTYADLMRQNVESLRKGIDE